MRVDGEHDNSVDPACAMAHGTLVPALGARVLVAVFAGPIATHLLHFAADCGFAPRLLEPDSARAAAERQRARWPVQTSVGEGQLGPETDVVVTDHDRPELGDELAAVLAYPVRWVGVIGSVRHTAPHVAALAARGVAQTSIARVHRPVGLNIGSKSPAEIALATVAGLIADRNNRPGGFTWTSVPAPATDPS